MTHFLALLFSQTCAESKFCHAENAIHRRPYFVAHVDQELALGTARLLRRNRVGQLRLRPGITDLQYRCSYSVVAQNRVSALPLINQPPVGIREAASLGLCAVLDFLSSPRGNSFSVFLLRPHHRPHPLGSPE
jgi:hypothetical protein